MLTFKSVKDFEEYLRNPSEIPDVVVIKDVIYTQDNYDMLGKEIHYGNLKHQRELVILTKDRYSSLKDSIIEEGPLGSYRNDITYVQ